MICIAFGWRQSERLHNRHPRRFGTELCAVDSDVRARYFADLEAARSFQCSVKEWASAMSDALIARSNGWRIPSMPDEVRAETMRPTLAAVLSCRKRLDWDSFMLSILYACQSRPWPKMGKERPCKLQSILRHLKSPLNVVATAETGDAVVHKLEKVQGRSHSRRLGVVKPGHHPSGFTEILQFR